MATKGEEIKFYERLHQELLKSSDWPADYLYKFIVRTDKKLIEDILEVFDGLDTEVEYKESGKGNYTSISLRLVLPSPEEVIKLYKEVGKIEGVISL